VIFATYLLCLLLVLLTVGSLADFLGRRPAILSALAMNVAAMIIFMMAGSAATLIVARAVQGFATGFAATTLGATILDTDSNRAPMLNSVTAYAGLSAETLGGGVLITFAPAREQLVYIVLLALTVIEITLLWFMAETSLLKPGALASLIPPVRVPPNARHFHVNYASPYRFLALGRLLFLSHACGGARRYQCDASDRRQPRRGDPDLDGGMIVVALRNVAPDRMLRLGIVALSLGVMITLAGVQWGLVDVNVRNVRLRHGVRFSVREDSPHRDASGEIG
jgi:MFS family permease